MSPRPRVPGQRRMTRFENAWACATFGAIYPADPRLGPSAASLDVEGYLVDVRTNAQFRTALGLRLALWMVALAPLFVLRRFATITGLAESEREALLRALLVNPLYPVRQLVILLKAIAALLYARAPEIRAAIAPPLPDALADTGPRLVTLGRGPKSEGREHNDPIEREDDHGHRVA